MSTCGLNVIKSGSCTRFLESAKPLNPRQWSKLTREADDQAYQAAMKDLIAFKCPSTCSVKNFGKVTITSRSFGSKPGVESSVYSATSKYSVVVYCDKEPVSLIPLPVQ